MGSDDSSFDDVGSHRLNTVSFASSQSLLSPEKPPSIPAAYLTHTLGISKGHIHAAPRYELPETLVALLSQSFSFQLSSTTPTVQTAAVAWLQASLMPQWRKANHWFLTKPDQVASRLLRRLMPQVNHPLQGDVPIWQRLQVQLSACIHDVRQQARKQAYSVLSYVELAAKVQHQLGYSKADRREANEPNSVFHQKFCGVLASLSVPIHAIDALQLLIPTGKASVALLSHLSFAVLQFKLPKLHVNFNEHAVVCGGDLTESQHSPRSLRSSSLKTPNEPWPYPHMVAHLHDGLFQSPTSLSSSSSMSKEDVTSEQSTHVDDSKARSTHPESAILGDKRDRQSSPAVGEDDESDDSSGFYLH